MTITKNCLLLKNLRAGKHGETGNISGSMYSVLRLLLFCYTFVNLYGCNTTGEHTTRTPPASTHAPVFVTAPSLELDPNLSTPLAGQLTFTTDIPTRVRLDIRNSKKQWSINLRAYSKHHSLPLLGLFPAETHTITVHVISHTGIESIYDHSLTAITDPLPEGFPSIKVKSNPAKMEPGYTLVEIIPEGSNTEFGAAIVIVDETGNIAWYQIGSHYTDVRQLANGNLLFIEGNKIVEMDMLGNHIHEWQAIGKSTHKISAIPVATTTFHHEVYPMKNGHLLTLSVEARPVSNFPINDKNINTPHKTAMVAGDLVIEFSQNGNIVHEWHMLDILDPRRIGYGSLGSYWNVTLNRNDTRDWSHGNAVIYGADDDSIIYSSRHQDVVAKFSRKTGQLIWLLGPHENWNRKQFGNYLLKPLNDDTPFFFPYHQHAHEITPNGHILLYDNGSYGASPFNPLPRRNEPFSRAVEYAINEQDMTVKKVWEYGRHAKPVYYSGALGDADYQPKTGNVLLVHGSLEGANKTNSAVILEVTHTTPAEEVFKMEVFDPSPDPNSGWRVYRSERISNLYP